MILATILLVAGCQPLREVANAPSRLGDDDGRVYPQGRIYDVRDGSGPQVLEESEK